jgi:hypothetical protein
MGFSGEALKQSSETNQNLDMPPLVFVRDRLEILKMYLVCAGSVDIEARIMPIYHQENAREVAKLVREYAKWEDSCYGNSSDRPKRSEEILGCEREELVYGLGEHMSAFVLMACSNPERGPEDSELFDRRGLRPFYVA